MIHIRDVFLNNKLGLVVSFAVLFTPFINFVSVNMGVMNVSFSEPFIFTFIAYFIVVMLSYGISKIAKCKFINVSSSISLLYLLLLYYEPLFVYVSNFFTEQYSLYGWPGSHIVALLIPLSISLFSLALFRYILSLKVYIFFTIVMLFLSIINILTSYISQIGENINKVSLTPKSSALYTTVKPKTLKNVYYIITDGLGSERGLISGGVSTDALKKLKNTLKEEGFYIANSSSSYNVTHVSIQSIFEMDYPVSVDSEQYYNRSAFFPDSVLRINAPDTVLKQELSSLGYEGLYWFGNGWQDCIERSTLDCPSINTSNLVNITKINSLMVYLEKSLYPRLLYKLIDFIDSNNSAIDNVATYLSNSNILENKHLFFFVHQMMPHPPYKTENCEPVFGAGETDWEDVKYKDHYNSSILCLNKKIKKIIRLINEKDKDAIVVIQADHGSNFRAHKSDKFIDASKEYLVERFSNFNAFRLPNSCNQYLYPDIGTVNSIRLVVACATGVAPKLVEDKSFYAAYESGDTFGKVIDVSNIVKH